ncbi:MAG: RHS repeat-associated core domain-containing protein [Acidobacteria bacterium]|nr:RHS repeat-associated core domain-containing protein [Acidobacteriota bacterium]
MVSGYPRGALKCVCDSVYSMHHASEQLGTAQMELSSFGYPVWKGEFAPFGQELSDPSTTTNRYKFTGKERDAESGLDYFGARYYSSTVGRWMSPDWAQKAEPVPYAKMDNPQSLNLYGYVGNNPINQVDADGHWPDPAFAGPIIANPQQAKDILVGGAKGAWNLIANTWNTVANLESAQTGQHFETMPVAQYSNRTQAVAGAITTLGIMATGLKGGAAEEGISDAALAGRANAIQAAQDTFGQTKSTTAAASVTDANGNTSVMVGSSRNALTPSQRAALRPGETAVTGSGHAETTVINAAKSQGMTVNSIAASRPICSSCAQAIQDAGARPITPLKQP